MYSYTDVIKRLNKNMHGDDPTWYRIPEQRGLAAQYLLLYELSLPYGLDLNDRIAIDKSATRVTVTVGDRSTVEFREVLGRARDWLRAEDTRLHVGRADRRLGAVRLHFRAQHHRKRPA